MNLPGDPNPPAVLEPSPEEQYASLRRLVHATAISVLLLTGIVFVFLYRQVVMVRRQTAELARYVAEVDRSGMPAFVDQVRAKFDEYRKTHPDFDPIFTKFWPTESAHLQKVTPAAGPTNLPVPQK